jgi:colicin import membrane protein
MTPATEQRSLAIVPADAETTALTRWQALAADIRIASDEAQSKSFNYRDQLGNRQARSWVAQLRKLKGAIERARKDAKAVHLERGRAVDQAAKDLAAEVELLIQPHETELLAIEAEEQARIARHQAVIHRIAALVETKDLINNGTFADVQSRIAELTAIDPSTMEEFESSAAADRDAAVEQLTALLEVMREQEAQAAELEKLKAAEAARQDAERIEQARQQAIQEERQRQEQERQAAAWREAQAIKAAEEAERRAVEAERQAAAARQRELDRVEAQRQAHQKAQEHRDARRKALEAALIAAMDGMTRASVAAAIANETLHPSIRVDWAAVPNAID